MGMAANAEDIQCGFTGDKGAFLTASTMSMVEVEGAVMIQVFTSLCIKTAFFRMIVTARQKPGISISTLAVPL